MRVTLAQLNPIVGDIEYNLKRLREAVESACRQHSDLLVLPELFLTGYPPRDLLERPWFIEQVEDGIKQVLEISAASPELGIILGVPTHSELNTGKGLYNSALFITGGQIRSVQHKSLLPIYDVFDEARYFDPAQNLSLIEFKGEKIGLSICEDAWNDPVLWPRRRMYDFDPISVLAQMGATLLVNISASPFHTGKEEIRHRLIRGHAERHRLPFLYVNQIGGNDELIFDGRSMVFDRDGRCTMVFPGFEEYTSTIDTAWSEQPEVYHPEEHVATVCNALILGLRDYVRKCGFSKVVLGLSGGIDSALTCYLAAAALGVKNVLGISMPSPFSSSGSVDDSRQLATNLGVEFKVISISKVYEGYLQALQSDFKDLPFSLAEENIQARVRGNILMAFSNKFGYLVLSTGNKSEMSVGYCTLYGDMCGGLSVLADVPKTLVYELSHYINRETELIPQAIIDKVPSAELRPDQTDQDSLPPYDVLDQILYQYIEENLSPSEIIAAGSDPAIVDWLVRAIDNNEYKRKQAPPGLRVTTKAFGAGRRMPIAAHIHI